MKTCVLAEATSEMVRTFNNYCKCEHAMKTICCGAALLLFGEGRVFSQTCSKLDGAGEG